MRNPKPNSQIYLGKIGTAFCQSYYHRALPTSDTQLLRTGCFNQRMKYGKLITGIQVPWLRSYSIAWLVMIMLYLVLDYGWIRYTFIPDSFTLRAALDLPICWWSPTTLTNSSELAVSQCLQRTGKVFKTMAIPTYLMVEYFHIKCM